MAQQSDGNWVKTVWKILLQLNINKKTVKKLEVVKDGLLFAYENIAQYAFTWLKFTIINFFLIAFFLFGGAFALYWLIVLSGLVLWQMILLGALFVFVIAYLISATHFVATENMIDIYDKKPLRGYSGFFISPKVILTYMISKFIIMLGSLLVIPGFYFSARLHLSHLIVMETGCSISQGLKKSWDMTSDYSVIFMTMSFIWLIFLALGLAFAILGAAVPLIFSKLLYVYLYRKLSKK